MDSAIGFPNTYPPDSDLSSGQCNPTFEQPGPGGYCYPMFEQLEPLLVLSDQGCSLNFITDGKWHLMDE